MSVIVFGIIGVLLGMGAERLLTPSGQLHRPRRRRLLTFGALGVVVILLAGTIGAYVWANSVFNRIEKVDVSTQLSHGSGTNYLLVGSDNGRMPGDQRKGVVGARSDTIMVLRVEGKLAKIMSLNRDLFVRNPATGSKGKLNATYNRGPANLVAAVTSDFAIPIDRYIEIDFVSFGGLVDSFSGIDVDFANPAFDLASGLDVKQGGRVHLDGQQALAYVRSRHYYEMIDGKPRAEGGLPDVNRTMRQQTFLRQIMAKAGAKRNPLTLVRAAGKMANGMRIDDDMTLPNAARFAWAMGRLNPLTVPLPVVPRRTSGGVDVLDLGPGAQDVLAQFR